MSDDIKQEDLAKQPEEVTAQPQIEPLTDEDLESASGGKMYCSAAACSG